MGWLDCLKPASFDDCTLRNWLGYYGEGVDLVLGEGDPPSSDNGPDTEGLLGLENELRFASLIILGAVAYRVIK